MPFYEHILTMALEKSECVALFIIVLLLVGVMHYSNLRQMAGISREMHRHVDRNDMKWEVQHQTNNQQEDKRHASRESA